MKPGAAVARTPSQKLEDGDLDEGRGDGSTPKPLLITVEQAADILTIGRSTIYQLIWRDELVPIRIGRSVRFTVDQLEEFVKRRRSEVS